MGNSGLTTAINSLDNFTVDIEGTLGVGYGGTGLTATSAGGILYGTAADAYATLGIGSDGQVLKVSSGAPSWQDVPGTGTVTSVDVDGASTGLTFGGGPVTTSGTITMGGTLNADYGGTGFDAYTTGDMLYADTATTLAKLAAATDGQVLQLASGVPTWADVDGTGTVTSITPGGRHRNRHGDNYQRFYYRGGRHQRNHQRFGHHHYV